jgi:transcriptional regulator with GAF, ATPase, and Fis domain
LAGSEFFGHERGAFTGAAFAREGAFALADGGTLFVDEVGELPLPLQAQLLRVIQEKTYKPVGSNLWKRTNFRLVAATNRDLEAEQRAGGFRSDFFHRLASNRCHLPPLRERCEDIVPLAAWFLREELGREVELDPVVQRYLVEREYPGNVRQLRQLMARIAARYAGEGPVTAGVIPDSERLPEHTQDPPWNDVGFEQAIRRAVLCGVHLKDIGRSAEELAEQAALEGEGGNVQRAARRLGVTDRALQMRRAARRREPA